MTGLFRCRSIRIARKECQVAGYADNWRTEGTETPKAWEAWEAAVAEHEAMDLLAGFFRGLDEEVNRAGVQKKQLAALLGLSPSSVTGMFTSGRGGNKTPPSWERVEHILRFCWDKRDHGTFPGMTGAAVTRGLKDAQARYLEGWKLRHAMLVRDMERARRRPIAAAKFNAQLPVTAAPEVRYSLPPDAAAFTGRGAELDEITTAVAGAAETGGVVAVGAIDGMPGVGKTALAVHAAHVLRDRFPDRQLFLNLHGHTPGHEPVRPHDALAGLLTAIGVDPRFLPGDLEGRAGMWRDKMAGQRALLVLDNTASSGQVAPLLPGAGGCLVLVTSRRHLGDLPGTITSVLLDALPPKEAEQMFTRLAPRASGCLGDVAEVVRLAGFLPLAISLLARVFNRHRSWSLADLATETQAGLLTLAAENDSVAAAFGVSYHHLDPVRQRLFCLLSIHPGTTTDAYAAAALAGIGLEEAAGLLDGLHAEGLLTETGHRRYSMHDLLRRYAHDLAAAVAADDAQRALERLLDYYQHTAMLTDSRLSRRVHRPAIGLGLPSTAVPDMPDRAGALIWARAERANMLACISATSVADPTRSVVLTAAISSLLRLDGPWADALSLHAAAAEAARQLDDQRNEANALTNLADMQRRTGDYRTAATTLKRALHLYRVLGDRLGEADTLNDLGDVWRMTDDYQAAAEVLEQALDLYEDLGERFGEANVLANLAVVRRSKADYAGAITAMDRALGLYQSLGDQQGAANALTYLGILRRLTGDYAGAITAGEQALTLYQSLDSQLGIANALNYLGETRSLTGDHYRAIAALERALDLYQDLNATVGVASVLRNLGVARRSSGDYQSAATALERALQLYRSLGDRLGEVETLNELGTLYRIESDLDQANSCHQRALDLARQIGSVSDEAHALAGLGRCALSAGHSTAAERNLRQAWEILQRIGAAEAATLSTELNALTDVGKSRNIL